MSRQEEDLKWFRENRETLLRLYPQQYIVISNKSVVYASPSFKVALDYAREKIGMGNFLVQQVEEVETIHHLYNHHIA
jgi:hypothetical protein